MNSAASRTFSILILGGSGFISGTLAREAVMRGHRVHAITRGMRALPEGVVAITADRSDSDGFARAVADNQWDLVVDCIGFFPDHVRQDVDVFRRRTPHLVFVSTDNVFDPNYRRYPQPEESNHYATDGYGGNKRQCERVLTDCSTGDMKWTIVRPCHVYGPGSRLGCMPNHARDAKLLDRMRRGETFRLVGGGRFLQQPLFARDLARMILSFQGNEKTYGQCFCAAGPDLIESRQFYDHIADVLGVDHPKIEELSVETHLRDNPTHAPFLCHRIYSFDRLHECGVTAPTTSLIEGIREHVQNLLQIGGGS